MSSTTGTQTKVATRSHSTQTRDDPEVERMFQDARQIMVTANEREASMAVRHEVPPNSVITYTYDAIHLTNGTLYTRITRENRNNQNQ